jgi:signal transduction histidine kinase
VAERVGEQILSGFEFQTGSGGPGEASGPGGDPKRADGDSPRWVVRREWIESERGADGFERRLELQVVEDAPDAAAGAPDAASRTKARVLFVPEAAEPREPGAEDELRDPVRDLVLLHRPGLGLRIPLDVPHGPVFSTLDRFGSELVFGSLAVLALGLVLAAAIVHRATAPLAALAGAARRIGAGERDVTIAGAPPPGAGAVRRGDEVGEAVAAFNAMSARLSELDRENRRLAEAEQLSELGEVARGLAHTLRNPLNALGLSLEELARGAEPARGAELAEAGRRQIRRLDGALRSFLALASAPAAEPEPVDLSAAAREAALEALQDGRGRSVRVEVDAPEPVVIRGVPAELRAVLQALAVNAVEASPEDGAVVVRVGRAPEDRAQARLEIEDEGAGLAPEVRDRLFSPHVTTKPHGSGMGLFLAQRLVSGRYGGALVLEPRRPAGTRAVATLGHRLGDRRGAAAPAAPDGPA